MKKINIIISLMIFLGALASSDIMAQKGPSKPEIAKWKLEDEHASIWEFKDDGKLYSSYEGDEEITLFTYTISSSKPICQEGVTLSKEQHIDFLQIKNENFGYIQCFYIYALNSERFTVMDALSGEVFAYIKAED